MMAHGHDRVSSAESRSRDLSGNIFVRLVVKPSLVKVLTISKRLTGKSLKRKGDTFERDLARWFNVNLFGGTERVTRAPLSGGGYTSLNAGGADLIGLPLVFVEAKRTEKLNIREALRQAIGNVFKRQSPDVPVVITRRSQEKLEDSIVALRLSDFTDMLEIVYRSQGYIKTLELDESPVDDDNQMSLLPDT